LKAKKSFGQHFLNSEIITEDIANGLRLTNLYDYVLEVGPLSEVFEGKQFGLIGNFPYNISSQIMFKMLDYKEHIPEMVGMFQKEVAERIVAEPGSKTYGVISVLIQAFYEGKYLLVGKELFQNELFTLRPEKLSVEDFVKLTIMIQDAMPNEE